MAGPLTLNLAFCGARETREAPVASVRKEEIVLYLKVLLDGLIPKYT